MGNPAGGWCLDFCADCTQYWYGGPQKRRIQLLNAFYFYRTNGIKYAVKMEINYGSNMHLVLD
jgi:hypothetical protein